jgi:hypothetical protein
VPAHFEKRNAETRTASTLDYAGPMTDKKVSSTLALIPAFSPQEKVSRSPLFPCSIDALSVAENFQTFQQNNPIEIGSLCLAFIAKLCASCESSPLITEASASASR